MRDVSSLTLRCMVADGSGRMQENVVATVEPAVEAVRGIEQVNGQPSLALDVIPSVIPPVGQTDTQGQAPIVSHAICIGRAASCVARQPA
jgi:hypothetical protein